MHRRRLIGLSIFAAAAAGSPRVMRAFAQSATPAAGSGLPVIRWELVQIAYSNDTTAIPDDPTKYTVQFADGGRVVVTADCNVGGGSYIVDGANLTISDMFTTLALCEEGSLGNEFSQNLGFVASYVLTSDPSDTLNLAMIADGGIMQFQPSLLGVTWQWTEHQAADGTVTTVADPTKYTLEFLDDGSIQVLADCNSGFGSATIEGSSIDLSVATTRMACAPESQSGDYLLYLDAAESYAIRNGQLELTLGTDGGVAVFQPFFSLDTGDGTPVSEDSAYDY